MHIQEVFDVKDGKMEKECVTIMGEGITKYRNGAFIYILPSISYLRFRYNYPSHLQFDQESCLLSSFVLPTI